MTPLKLDYAVRIAILYYAGESAELQDNEITYKQIKNALVARGHIVREQEVTKKNWRSAVRTPGEVVFNLVEDYDWSLYRKVGEALERMGRAQVGHDLRSFRYAISKSALKKKMHRLGISTPAYRIFNRRSKMTQIRGLEYPLIVKPSRQHAGVGISQDSVVIDEVELKERVEYLFKHFPGEVVAEQYVDGKEIHITVLGNGKHLAVLPYAELEFKGEFANNWDVYSYDAKWAENSWEYWNVPVRAPALVSEKLDKRLMKLAKKAFRKLGCVDVARFDIRVDEKENPYIIDVNFNPSLREDEYDATWISAESIDWNHSDLLETIVGITYKRVYRRLPDHVRERQFLLTQPLI